MSASGKARVTSPAPQRRLRSSERHRRGETDRVDAVRIVQAEPFWGGTYFPKEPRFGRPSFVDLLRAVAHTYESQPERITSNRTTLLQSLEAAAVEGGVIFPHLA